MEQEEGVPSPSAKRHTTITLDYQPDACFGKAVDSPQKAPKKSPKKALAFAGSRRGPLAGAGRLATPRSAVARLAHVHLPAPPRV